MSSKPMRASEVDATAGQTDAESRKIVAGRAARAAVARKTALRAAADMRPSENLAGKLEKSVEQIRDEQAAAFRQKTKARAAARRAVRMKTGA